MIYIRAIWIHLIDHLQQLLKLNKIEVVSRAMLVYRRVCVDAPKDSRVTALHAGIAVKGVSTVFLIFLLTWHSLSIALGKSADYPWHILCISNILWNIFISWKRSLRYLNTLLNFHENIHNLGCRMPHSRHVETLPFLEWSRLGVKGLEVKMLVSMALFDVCDVWKNHTCGYEFKMIRVPSGELTKSYWKWP